MRRRFKGGYNPDAKLILWHGTTSGAGRRISRKGLSTISSELGSNRKVAVKHKNIASSFLNHGSIIKVSLPIKKIDRYIKRARPATVRNASTGKTSVYSGYSLKTHIPAKYISIDQHTRRNNPKSRQPRRQHRARGHR
jgi:hypothetical protein